MSEYTDSREWGAICVLSHDAGEIFFYGYWRSGEIHADGRLFEMTRVDRVGPDTERHRCFFLAREAIFSIEILTSTEVLAHMPIIGNGGSAENVTSLPKRS